MALGFILNFFTMNPSTSNVFSEEPNAAMRTSRRKWFVEKNYAPLVNKTQRDFSLQQLGIQVLHDQSGKATHAFLDRQVAQNQLYARQQGLRAELIANANKAFADQALLRARQDQKKIDARLYYQSRIAKRNYVPKPVNLSPYLDPDQMTSSTIEQRLKAYGVRHKCEHGRRFTDLLLMRENTPGAFYSPVCFCATEIVHAKSDFRCTNCHQMTHFVSDPTCPAEIKHCKNCKTTYYRTVGVSIRRPTHLKVVREMEVEQRPVTSKTWSIVPTVCIKQSVIDEHLEKEFPVLEMSFPKVELQSGRFHDMIMEPLTGLYSKVKTFLKTLEEWAVSLAAGLLTKAVQRSVWQLLYEFCDTMYESFMRAPSSAMLSIYRLFSTESNLERLLAWSVLLGDSVLSKVVQRVKEAFLGSGNVELQSSIPWAFLLGKLFQLPQWVMKHRKFLDLMRDFNTAMSTWKNLHELVNNFIQYLPSWFTRLFQITDPRKRFGTEAHAPGNPIYDMMQAYMVLLRGENCASPSAYQDFQRKWKLSDEYITSDYPPNETVIRLHKHFWTNAAAIMKPGTHGSKPIPYVITLFGPPGTGKSTSCCLLLSGIIKGSLEEIVEKSYTRNPCSEYFDGYNPEKHKVFIYDDFGSLVDDDAASELMAIVSNADYLPPYASLNDPSVGIKGTSFASPIVILNSNFKTFSQCKQIADKVALQRRLGVIIGWNKRITTGREEYLVTRAQPDGSQVPVLNELGTNSYSLFQLQEFLKEDYIRHFREQSAVTDHLNSFRHANPIPDFMDVYHSAKYGRVELQAGDEFYDSEEFVVTSKSGYESFPRVEMAKRRDFGFGFVLAITRKFKDAVMSVEKSILKALATFAVAFGLVFAAFSLLGTSKSHGELHSGEGATRLPRANAWFARPQKASLQCGEQEENQIRKVMLNHVCLVRDDGLKVHGMFLKGQVLLTVKHFVKGYRGSLRVCSHRASDGEIYEVDMKEVQVVEFDDVDLAMLVMPLHVQPYRDITSMLAAKPHAGSCMGYVTRYTGEGHNIYRVPVVAAREHLEYTHEGEFCQTVCDFYYELAGRRGDCGNPIFIEQGGALVLLGMHFSGGIDPSNRDLSYATMVNRAEVLNYLRQVEPHRLFSRSSEMRHEVELQLSDAAANNKCQCEFESKTHIMSSNLTSLRPSEIVDTIQQHTCEPAILKTTNGIDPMLKALNKLGKSTRQFPSELIEQAANAMAEELGALMSDKDIRRPLTLHEALNGIPGKVESIDASTSSGYPFSLNPRLRGAKSKLLVGEPGSWQLGPEAQQHFEEWRECLERGEIPSDPFIVTLKDEKRKIEKVAQGKTRLFCAGSLTMYLWNKMMFGGFCEFFQRTRMHTFSTLGLNRGSAEWHQMISRMMEVGPDALDGDQEEWDGRFKAAVAMALLIVFERFYGDSYMTYNWKIRYLLFQHAVFAHCRVTWSKGGKHFTYLFVVPGTMPSGWFLTFLVNSLVNALLFRMAWLVLVSPPYNDLYYYRLYVREKYAGDDNLLSVSQAFLDQFNNETIKDFFSAYDQIYTASDKGEVVRSRHLLDCAFLKTKTQLRDGRYLPIFDEQANLETLNWIRKCPDTRLATEDNCNDVLRNAFFYGREYFEALRKKILAVVPDYKLISYAPLESAFLDFGSIPDPDNVFGYTKHNVRDPRSFFKAVSKAQQLRQSCDDNPAIAGNLLNPISS